MIVNRSFLARAPHEAYQRKALQEIAVQQILPIASLVRLGKDRRQPIVPCKQVPHQRPRALEQGWLVQANIRERGHVRNELFQTLDSGHHAPPAVIEEV
jgi:hypothetical protein